MGKKSKAPPAPDYSGVAAASQQASQYSYKLGEDQLAWAKTQDAENQALNQKVTTQLMSDDQKANTWADQDRALYQSTTVPMMQDYATKAQNWASPGMQETQAGLAQAGVAQQAESARHAATDTLESYGVDPGQTRIAALDLSSRVAEAAASAEAGNTARINTQMTGMQLEGNAIAQGQNLPQQALGAISTGNASGNQAVNNSLATTASGASTMGSAPQWQTLGNQAVGQWGNTLHQGYSDVLGRFEANQNASSGLGSLFGTALGMGTSIATGGFTHMPKFATGGAVPMPQAPQQGAIPMQASPSGGRAVDDVPAQLTAGEYVIPKDAAMWLGEQKLQQLVEKTRKDRMGAAQPGAPVQGAQPQQGMPQQGMPQHGAIPMQHPMTHHAPPRFGALPVR